MPGNLQPLDQKFPIVDPATGQPTLYFIKWAQQRQIDITSGITAEQAQQLILDFMNAHQLQKGLGISITPDGNLASDPTIALDAVLDDLNDVDTVTTPPTDGQALVWNDANALWEPGDVASGGGGGGGSLTEIASFTLSSAAAQIDFTNIPAGFRDLVLVIRGRAANAAATNQIYLRFNGDTGNNYQYEFLHSFANGTSINQATNQSAGRVAEFPAASATANYQGAAEIQIIDYLNTATYKQAFALWGSTLGTGGFNVGVGTYSVGWASLAAINSISVLTSAANLAAGFTATLYGRGPAPKTWPGNVISEYTCTGGETSIDFPDIPQTFRDLKMVMNGRGTAAAVSTQTNLRFNGDAGANYDWQYHYGNGASSLNAASFAQNSGQFNVLPGASAPAGMANVSETTIANYASSAFYKAATTKDGANAGTSGATLFSGTTDTQWRSTAAINRITVLPVSGAFAAGTRITLYGIGGPGGQTIYSRPWYWSPPTASSFTLAASTAPNPVLIDDLDVGLRFDGGVPVAGDEQRVAYRTLTNKLLAWEVTFRSDFFIQLSNYTAFGLMFWDSVGGRNYMFSYQQDGVTKVQRYSAFGAYLNNAATFVQGIRSPNSVWYRATFDGTNYRFYVGPDGKNWTLFCTLGATEYLAAPPDRIGIVSATNLAGGFNTLASIDHFLLTGPAV